MNWDQHNWVIGLLLGGGFVLVLAVAALLWQVLRSAYFWTAAKIHGWDHHEKFMRETAWVAREGEKQQRQAAKDADADTGDRRRMGAFFLTYVIGGLAWNEGLPWWGTATNF